MVYILVVQQTGCVWREGQGLAHDGFCTRPAQYKRGIVCLARNGWLETEGE